MEASSQYLEAVASEIKHFHERTVLDVVSYIQVGVLQPIAALCI